MCGDASLVAASVVVCLVVVVVLMPASVVHIVLHTDLSVGVVVVRHNRHYPHQRAEHQEQIGYVLDFLHRGHCFFLCKDTIWWNFMQILYIFFRSSVLKCERNVYLCTS